MPVERSDGSVQQRDGPFSAAFRHHRFIDLPGCGPSGLGLPDNVFKPGGRQRFPSLSASLITGC